MYRQGVYWLSPSSTWQESLIFSLLRLWRRYEWECEPHDFSELLSILEPLRIYLSSVFRSWIRLRLSIFEEMDCLWKRLQKECAITGECEHLLSRIYPIFSEHCLRMDFSYTFEAFEEIIEGGSRCGHDSEDYSVSKIPLFWDKLQVFSLLGHQKIISLHIHL